MPMITVQLKEGRTQEQMKRAAVRITDACIEELGVASAGVGIAFEESDPEKFFAGYKTLGELSREKAKN